MPGSAYSGPRKKARKGGPTRKPRVPAESITNNFELPSVTIAQIYKQRWQIELFFRWIKQNLKLKTFLGTSRNAVMAQVWVAMIYYLLIAYIKFISKVAVSITEVSRRIKDGLMSRLNLLELLATARDKIKKPPGWQTDARQPELFALGLV